MFPWDTGSWKWRKITRYGQNSTYLGAHANDTIFGIRSVFWVTFTFSEKISAPNSKCHGCAVNFIPSCVKYCANTKISSKRKVLKGTVQKLSTYTNFFSYRKLIFLLVCLGELHTSQSMRKVTLRRFAAVSMNFQTYTILLKFGRDIF